MPSSKPIPGVNDLQSQFPEIAAEAYGWDPLSVTKGSTKKLDWKCIKGHIWNISVNSRTCGSGCPVCSNQKLLVGYNDLKTKFPEIAAEAYGWDPSTIIAGTRQTKEWRCNNGHTWNATVSNRTGSGRGCPVCSNQKLLVGYNDLKTKFPEIAAEAYGWDPSIVFAGSTQKKKWKCKAGHIFDCRILNRKDGIGCSICSGRTVLSGYNDLKTKFPEIAAEAYGWDPSTVIAGTHQKKKWKCNVGHTWNASIANRTGSGRGCPVCSNKQLLVGYNDLKTKFPEIAAEAYGWDPSTVIAGTEQKKEWKCGNNHIYTSAVYNRTIGKGCPICAEYGFNPSKDACFYLMQRPGEQQLGITNELDVRRKTHERNGWTLVEHTEPASGQKVLDTENAFKKWLKKEIGLIKGTTENWSTTSMEVQSLAELKARSGIETDLF